MKTRGQLHTWPLLLKKELRYPLYKEVGWLGHGTGLEVLGKENRYKNSYQVCCGKINSKYIGSRIVVLDKGMEIIWLVLNSYI
jgi:hypothetical protein